MDAWDANAHPEPLESRSTLHENDVTHTHNRLHSHIHGRCLMICRSSVVDFAVDIDRRRFVILQPAKRQRRVLVVA